ncbi:hypothetical protein [Entomohabitans teleogrylli]|uniref:hypothetical protein n=1 Tax=Entomohabitans teleogrylli TaxID=1384589 RepID=UPI00073D89F8|nr:hypothetical protein [Entomohabitans teleogrylli]
MHSINWSDIKTARTVQEEYQVARRRGVVSAEARAESVLAGSRNKRLFQGQKLPGCGVSGQEILRQTAVEGQISGELINQFCGAAENR